MCAGTRRLYQIELKCPDLFEICLGIYDECQRSRAHKECRAHTECRAHKGCQRNRAQQTRQHRVCKEAPRKGNSCTRETRWGHAQVGQALSVSQHLAVAEARAVWRACRAPCVLYHTACIVCITGQVCHGVLTRTSQMKRATCTPTISCFTVCNVFTYAHACRCA